MLWLELGFRKNPEYFLFYFEKYFKKSNLSVENKRTVLLKYAIAKYAIEIFSDLALHKIKKFS